MNEPKDKRKVDPHGECRNRQGNGNDTDGEPFPRGGSVRHHAVHEQYTPRHNRELRIPHDVGWSRNGADYRTTTTTAIRRRQRLFRFQHNPHVECRNGRGHGVGSPNFGPPGHAGLLELAHTGAAIVLRHPEACTKHELSSLQGPTKGHAADSLSHQ